jgi:hypothetical protein
MNRIERREWIREVRKAYKRGDFGTGPDADGAMRVAEAIADNATSDVFTDEDVMRWVGVSR